MPYKSREQAVEASRRWRKTITPEQRLRYNERRKMQYQLNIEESRRRKREASQRDRDNNPGVDRERRRRFKEERPELHARNLEVSRIARKLKIPCRMARDLLDKRITFAAVEGWIRAAGRPDVTATDVEV